MVSFDQNLTEVDRLVDIHSQISGSGPGYKHNVQVLNKSSLVLLVSCWEAYIEELAKNSFDAMLTSAKGPDVFPIHVLDLAAKEIKKDNNSIWALHGDGWKNELIKHREKILSKYTEGASFNTPSPKNIDKLISELIGLTSLSSNWYWPKMKAENAREKLEWLISFRGEIAHKVATSSSAYKSQVHEYRDFLDRLSVISNNRVLDFLKQRQASSLGGDTNMAHQCRNLTSALSRTRKRPRASHAGR